MTETSHPEFAGPGSVPPCLTPGIPGPVPPPERRKAGLYAVPPAWTADVPMLHQSIASVIANRSPLHAWHKAFAEEQDPYDEARNMGQLAHSLLLGGQGIEVIDAPDWRTNAAKEQRESARTSGKIPVLVAKFAEAEKLAGIVRAQLEVRGIELTGQSEITAIWRTSGRVWCQARLDHLILPKPRHKQKATIYDFKFTSAAATKKACEGRFIEYGYDIQHCAYVEAIEKVFPKLQGRVKMEFIFVETDLPHAIRVMPVGGSMRTSGQWRWGKAVEIWQECLEKYGTGTPWPSYSDDGALAECPPWALNAQVAEEYKEEISEEV